MSVPLVLAEQDRQQENRRGKQQGADTGNKEVDRSKQGHDQPAIAVMFSEPRWQGERKGQGPRDPWQGGC